MSTCFFSFGLSASPVICWLSESQSFCFVGAGRFASAALFARRARAAGFPVSVGVSLGSVSCAPGSVLVGVGSLGPVRQARQVACPCCSSFGARALGFCLSCGFVRSLVPVLLFAGLVLSSCSRAVVIAQAPCQVLVSEAPQGQVFFSQPVVPGRSVGRSQWFGFQCQFPAWVGSGVAASVAIQGSEASEVAALPGEYVLQQSAGGWGFWVPVGELPAGWQRVQWVASGQVGAR